MSDLNNIVIFSFANDVPPGLRETLKSKGLSTSSSSDSNKVVELLSSSENSATLVYLSENSELEKVTGELSELTQLHSWPLIIVGKEVDRYESFLNRFFILATTITLPCEFGDIVSAIRYVSRYLEKLKTKKISSDSAQKLESKELQKIFKGFSAIPKITFDKLKELNLFEKELGGAYYATTFKPQVKSEKLYLPNDPKVVEIITKISEDLSIDRLSRYCRIGSLTYLIITGLGYSKEVMESAKIASMCYSSGILFQEKSLTQTQYLIGDSDLIRKEICSRIKDSIIEQEIFALNKQAKEIALLVAKLIGFEESLDNTTESICASAIATADAIDRVIFQRNVFQPVGAYSVLSLFKKQEISFIHPLVLAVIVKLLAEAVSSDISVMNKSKRYQQMNQLIDAASEIDEAIISGGQRVVSLANLQPGMKLSKNGISTADGFNLLTESMELDQDLIWRLWQLSSVRPIQKKIIVDE
jgi:hypothetical protein